MHLSAIQEEFTGERLSSARLAGDFAHGRSIARRPNKRRGDTEFEDQQIRTVQPEAETLMHWS